MEAIKTYIKELRKIPLLTAKQEIELSKRIHKGDEHARKAMIRANLRLVINIAKRYMFLGAPLLDLIEEGNIGLMKAVDKFNPKKGYRFSTYAAWWIKQAITRSISEQSKMIRVPVYMNEMIGKWKKTKERMAQKLKRVPSDKKVAKKLKISDSKMQELNFWLSSTTSSLDAPVGEDDASQVADLIEDEGAVSPDAGIEKALKKERIGNLLDRMSRREKDILDMRFGLLDGKTHTLAQVAKKFKLSRERVRQIEERALEKLRDFVHEQEKTIYRG
jgi:RNA polymerase primary sigma factor